MKNKWVLVHAENVKPFVCSDSYSSKMLTGNEMAGMPIININEGTLAPKSATTGGSHDKAEIYYVLDGEGFIWLDEDCLQVKTGDVIVIPPHVVHWIDNTKSEKPFKILTFWPDQEDNEVFFLRENAWGTSVALVDENYEGKRLV